MLSLIIPKEVDLLINENWIQIKGPKGLIKKKKSKEIQLNYNNTERILYLMHYDMKQNHFCLSLINKLIWGVWKGYSVKLNIIGVGYKAVIENKNLILKIGFSHTVKYKIPEDIQIKILNKKLLTLVILSNNLQRATQIAAEIKSLKPVEPYKGKGIKYFKEVIKLKEGKKTNV
jgi:large subunit ribosomal protein L6